MLQWVDQVALGLAWGEPAAQTGGTGWGRRGSPPWRSSRCSRPAGRSSSDAAGGAGNGRPSGCGELEEVKSVANEDLVALSDDIRTLDLDTSMPDADPEAATTPRRSTSTRRRHGPRPARRVEDLAPMSAALEAGRPSMASTKAILEGRPLPERRPPCFFDPRHGPSVEDVQWAPPDGAPRTVPACAADAQRVHDGLEPESRQVLAGAGGRRPRTGTRPATTAPGPAATSAATR